MSLSEKECIQLNQSVFSMANAYRTQMVHDGLLEETGLTLSDRSALLVLGQLEPVVARDLAARMDINPGTVSVHVQRLVDLGLVERVQDETDRRTWWLSLSEEGAVAYGETIDRAVSYTRGFLAPLSPEECGTLHALTLRVAKGLGYAW